MGGGEIAGRKWDGITEKEKERERKEVRNKVKAGSK